MRKVSEAILGRKGSWRYAVLTEFGGRVALSTVGGMFVAGLILKLYGALKGAKWAWYSGHGMLVVWTLAVGASLVYFAAQHTKTLGKQWPGLGVAARAAKLSTLVMIWAGLLAAAIVALIFLF